MPREKRPSPKNTDKASKKQTVSEFESLNLPEPVIQGIRDAGFMEMTPIQREALPVALSGQDICGQAQTGTGKTATFLISIFATVLKEKDPGATYPTSLILAPTRELALQTYREAKLLGAHTGLQFAAIYGGEGFFRQEKKLRSGVDMVVGTPGRLIDFAKRRVLDLSHIKFLVIDEADKLLDMGFYEELRDIMRRLPPAKQRQSMLFSATLDFRAKQIASAYMRSSVDIAVRPESITADGIEQLIYHVDRDMKFRLLLGILEKEDIPKGLIFTNRKVVASWLVRKLHDHGYVAELLTGDLRQTVRNKVLDRFKEGGVKLMVASDVASRGLHIDDVTHIINYDVPQDPEDYVHRIGRTARAGKKGKAYTLACDEYCWTLPEIEKLLQSSPPYLVPDGKDFAEDKTPRFTVYDQMRLERQKKSDNKNERNQNRGPKTGSRGYSGSGSRNRSPRSGK